ncbi:MAG: serine hydrolase domain-containing protein [Blastocatellales bacterium]
MKIQTSKPYSLFNRLTVAFIAAICALAALQQFRSARAAASPVLAVAATPTPVPKTDFDIYPLNSNGAVQAKSGGASWLGNVPGYNITRVFKNGANQSYVIMLNGNTGRGRAYALDSDGSLGAAGWETGNDVISDLRCTAAETVKIGATSYLITHDSFTGKVRTFHLYNNGQPNLGTMTVLTHSDWKDKNLFSLYYYNGAYYLLGVDTWTGNAVAYSINGQKIGEADWSRGWTSVDHLAVGGVTYRLLYKAAGDPHKAPGEANDQRGRFVIQTVNANGVTGQNIYDAPIGADFSSVRFVPLYNGQGFNHGIFFFKRDTAHYVVRQFNSQNGVGAIMAFGQAKDGPDFDDVAPAYVDIEPYTIGVNTFLATVSDDNSKPLYFAAAEKMAHTIHDGLKNKVVGYQFMVAQSGRVIYSRGWGKKHLLAGANNVSDEWDMTTRTSHSLASISKMITAMTILKLAEMGEIDLDAPINDYLPADQKSPGSWAETMTVRSLLTHTSGVTKNECETKDGNFDPNNLPQVDCKPFFQTAQDSAPCELKNGQMVCARSYNNSNFAALRKIIEFKTGAQSSQDIVAKTRELWADSVDLGGLTCQYSPTTYYFGRCKGLDDCLAFNGQLWQQGQSFPLWDEGCGAGGWNASSRQLIEFLGAIRYRKFLNSASTNQLLDITLKDSNEGGTALGWDAPYSLYHETQLGKGGDSPGDTYETHTWMTRMPGNCDAVILVNTDISGLPGSLLGDAYRHAVSVNDEKPIPPPIFYDIATNGKGDGETISRVAVNTVKTGASENQHVVAFKNNYGSLKLAAWNVDRNEGQITFKDDATAGTADGALAIHAKELAISDGVNFATASLGADDKLTVIPWKYDGAKLTQYGLGFGVEAQEAAVTKAQGTGSTGRVVTAIRTMGGNLRLDVWEFNNTNNTVTLKDTYTAGVAQEIAIKTLKFGAYLSSTARVVTALRNGSGQLQVDLWDVNSSGQLQRLGKGLFGEVTATTNSLFKIAIDTDSEGGDFFDTFGFMTAFINQDGKAQIATWSVSGNGMIVDKRGDDIYDDEVSDLAASASLVTMRRSSDDKLRTAKWKINSDGGIAGYSARSDKLTVKRVSATANFFTAFQLTNDFLRVYNWKITE